MWHLLQNHGLWNVVSHPSVKQRVIWAQVCSLEPVCGKPPSLTTRGPSLDTPQPNRKVGLHR
jgi:hypothetical protein